jgi:hypothetical protein
MNIKAILGAYFTLAAVYLVGVVIVAAQQPEAGVAVVDATVVGVEHGKLLPY